MQATIEVPDTLPQERARQRIKELEESLRAEADFLKTIRNIMDETTSNDDPWTNPDVELPSVDTGIEDLSLNHDHYLYGTSKRS